MKFHGLLVLLISVLGLASYPSGACACAEGNAIPVLLKTILFVVYLMGFPIALLALGANRKQLGLYVLIFCISCLLWWFLEIFFVLFPTLPWLAIVWYVRKNKRRKGVVSP
jgi:hypothetical protein